MKKSNLYAEKIYSDHPIALWALDDNIDFFQLLSSSQQDITSSNWIESNGTKQVINIGQIIPVQEGTSSKFTLTSSSASLSSSFSFNSINSFNNSRKTACFSFYAKPNSNEVNLVRVGVSIDSIDQYTEYTLNEEWNLVSHSFDIPETSSTITLFIHFFTTSVSSTSTVNINAVSLGQWSEEYIEKSIGFNEADLPAEIENIIFNGSQYSQTTLDAYGINSDFNGYYLTKSNEVYSKPSGIPLVFGSYQSVKIDENLYNPSIVFPGCGLFNESGKYNNYTLEFWTRLYNKSIDPIRIIGPLSSSDGIYLEEGFISIYVGPYTKSYFLGKYDRPMLVHILYSESFVSVMVNGEQVISMDIDINNIVFPEKESGGYSLDWFGVYGNDLIFPFEIDCISIYPYLMPSELAKKHFIYGQGVEELYSAPSLLSKDVIEIDFPFAEYSFNVSYPDLYDWKQGFSVNTNANSYLLETAKYDLPSVIIKNENTEIDESEWFLSNREINNNFTDIFPYILMDPNSINDYASIYFDNISLLTSKVESIFGVFKSPSSSASNQIIFKFFNKNTNEAVAIRLDGGTLKYIYIDPLLNETVLASESISVNTVFNAGINITDFTSEHFFTIRNFFSNHAVISLAIGGSENENIFNGKIYGVHAVDLFFYNKELSEYFTNGLVEQQSPASDLIKYIGNYSLLPVYKNITMGFDIGSSCYWEDILPLSIFGKNIASGSGYVYDLDMIQFNIDAPYRQGIDESQGNNYYYYTILSYLNLEDKDYNYFQSLGYTSYEDLDSYFIENISSLRYSTSFNSFITIQDYEDAGNKNYSDFNVSMSADSSKVIFIESASASNKKYEIFDNYVIVIPYTINFIEKYLGIHIDLKIRGTIEKNMGIKRMQLSSFAFNDGKDTKVGTKYSYPIYPKAESA